MKRILILILVAMFIFSGCSFVEGFIEGLTEDVETDGKNDNTDNLNASGSDNRGAIEGGKDTDLGDILNNGQTMYSEGELREYFTKIKGNGEDTNTIMLYCIGSDLESEDGSATADISEILEADLGGNVNFLIQTGGALNWQIDGIYGDTCQRFSVGDGELIELEDIGLQNMVKKSTLVDFINWGTQNYPANRYHLIFWDHGGGTISGFGYDENFPEETLTLGDIADALKQTNIKFDMVGFDACLMGTIETAYVISNYADYLVASEETEPGTGWYYTNWLNKLGNNPSISTVDLAKVIIDDFVENGPDVGWFDENSLSIVDLREIPKVYETLQVFMANSKKLLDNNGFSQIATARGKVKEFGDGEYEQIDIINYIDIVDIEGGQQLKQAINSAVKYANTNIKGANGLAMYYPYSMIEYYQDTLDSITPYGFQDEYADYYDEFVNSMAYMNDNYGFDSVSSALTGEDMVDDTDFSIFDWFIEGWNSEFNFDENYDSLQSDILPIVEKGEYYVLQLSDEEWSKIINIEQQVYIDDGEGYIELGYDNLYEFDEDGDLYIDFDYTWVAIDGNITIFYIQKTEETDDGGWYTYGYVPAILNGDKDVNVYIQWDSEHDYGYILGYKKTVNGVAPTSKGYSKFSKGDYIQCICDYYTYDGEYDDEYLFGDEFYISMDSEISYEDIGDETVEVCFKLTDIYNNDFWTETVILTVD